MSKARSSRRPIRSKDARTQLRSEFYDRVERGDIGLVEAVKIMRRIAGQSQAAYARLVGVSPRVLIDFERGVGNPTIATLAKIIRPFNLELTVRRTPEP